MRRTKKYRCAVVAMLALGCAEIFPSTEPGTPGGGPYCSRMQSGEKACYPTEAERAAAYHGEQAELARPAQEQALAKARAAESARQSSIQTEQAEKADAAAAARDERERKRQEWVAEQDRKEALRAAEATKVRDMALDKEYAGPAISAIMCSIDAEVRALRVELDREKRVTAVGGVVDLGARNRIATELVDDADELAEWRKSLSRLGAARSPCKEVADVEPCRQDLTKCEGQTRDVARVWAEQLDTLWGSEKKHPAR